MSPISITITPAIGADIVEVFTAAIALARHLNMNVDFTINDIFLSVAPDDFLGDIISNYEFCFKKRYPIITAPTTSQ